MNIAQSDGSLAPVDFLSSAAGSYNEALAKLQVEIQTENNNVAGAQALQKEQQNITADANAVQSMICPTCKGTIESTIAGTVAAIPETLASEVKNLQSTYAAEQTVLAQGNSGTSGNLGNFCNDVGNVVNDFSNVINEASNLSYDASNVQSDISEAQGLLSTLKADFSKYQEAQAQLPSFAPENPPTEQEVSAAVDRVNTAITSAITTTNQYIDQANADVSTAYGYATAATKAGNCGGAPAPPQPVPHI